MPRPRCTCGGTGADGCRPRRAAPETDLSGFRHAFVTYSPRRRSVLNGAFVLPASRYNDLMAPQPERDRLPEAVQPESLHDRTRLTAALRPSDPFSRALSRDALPEGGSLDVERR